MLHFPMANSVPAITLSAKTRAVEADVFLLAASSEAQLPMRR